jgi:hypothetical protein
MAGVVRDMFLSIALASAIGFAPHPLNSLPLHPGQPVLLNAGAQRAAIAFPWSYSMGTGTSRRTAADSVDELEQKAGYSAMSAKNAGRTWSQMGMPMVSAHKRPSAKQLEAFGKKVGADVVFYGSVGWHTRSIWVGAGPKTISTATASVYVFDVHKDRVVYSKRGVTGRSDERDSDLKLVADVLLTPLVSGVSGGPATPREQRAAQIALSRAYHAWVVRTSH